jgi:hypothetical protein
MAELQTEQLDKFYINSGLDTNEMNHNFFKNYVEQNLFKSIHLLEKEIKHNLLILDTRRLEIYFNQVIEKLDNSTFLKFDDSIIDKYIKEYDLDKENILNINNKELISFLNRTGDPFDPFNGPDSDLYFKAEKIKRTFYKYVAKHEILFFIEKVKEMQSENLGLKPSKKSQSKDNQLTSNQIVVLLDKLGFFTHPIIEDISRTKQAELISLISGLNSKNFETYIGKLEEKEPTKNYQKDIIKIDKILDSLI